jgi:predicted nuclease of predicted toxin-antitoxin system
MLLKFFADHCVPTSVILALRASSYEVLVLREHIPTDSPDEKVIAKAQELDCILISLNGDFSDIVAYPPFKYKGIISLQIRNHPESILQIVEKLKEHLSEHNSKDDYNGKLLLVEAHRIRIRT